MVALSNDDLYKQLQSVDQKTANRLHPNNRRRVFSALQTYYRDRQSLSDYLDDQHSKVRKYAIILWFLKFH